MAVAIGARPSIFFSSTDSKEISVVHTAVTDAKAAKAERQFSFDCKRGLLALAAHPTDASTLYQLHDDLTISAIAIRSSQRNPDLLWNTALQPASNLATEVRTYSGPIFEAAGFKIILRTSASLQMRSILQLQSQKVYSYSTSDGTIYMQGFLVAQQIGETSVMLFAGTSNGSFGVFNIDQREPILLLEHHAGKVQLIPLLSADHCFIAQESLCPICDETQTASVYAWNIMYTLKLYHDMGLSHCRPDSVLMSSCHRPLLLTVLLL